MTSNNLLIQIIYSGSVYDNVLINPNNNSKYLLTTKILKLYKKKHNKWINIELPDINIPWYYFEVNPKYGRIWEVNNNNVTCIN